MRDQMTKKTSLVTPMEAITNLLLRDVTPNDTSWSRLTCRLSVPSMGENDT